MLSDATRALLTIPCSPVDNDRYVRTAPDNPKKVCYLLQPLSYLLTDQFNRPAFITMVRILSLHYLPERY